MFVPLIQQWMQNTTFAVPVVKIWIEVPLELIALKTGVDEIRICIITAVRDRAKMIHRQGPTGINLRDATIAATALVQPLHQLVLRMCQGLVLDSQRPTCFLR